MKNMKVAKKLILGFLIVTLLCATVGGVGIYGMFQINNACSILYDEQTKPLPDIAHVLEHIQLLRVHTRNAIILTGYTERLAKVEKDMTECIETLESCIVAYDETIKNQESRMAYDDAKNLYFTVLKPGVLEILEDAKAGVGQAALLEDLEEMGYASDSMLSDFALCMRNKVAGGEAANLEGDLLFARLLVTIIVVIAVSIAVAMWLAFYISRMISGPINTVSQFLQRFGKTGDSEMTDSDRMCYENRNNDELGACQESLFLVINRLHDLGDVLGKVVDGDLTAKLELLSENDRMGFSLNKMMESLNTMFGELRVASGQVSSGSGQVSQAAQNLASGSTQQAATIQEFAASLAELREHTNHNAGNSVKAREASEKSSLQLKESMLSMDEMMVAMDSIDESSRSITKVIKVIDDIAFQTNILALNAAVEAARAGQHGKGFAVVADEVRNLAAKSAEAAKETAGLIEGSGERVKEGNEIVSKTKSSLEMVSEFSRELAQLVDEVAISSTDQAKSIVEINQGLEQISTVVQANSATAEESAAASQEMSAQAVLLDEIVARFKLKEANTREMLRPNPAALSNVREKAPEKGLRATGFSLSYANQ